MEQDSTRQGSSSGDVTVCEHQAKPQAALTACCRLVEINVLLIEIVIKS